MTYRIKSGVYTVRPKKVLFLNVNGPFSITPKQVYHVFRSDMIVQGQEAIIIVKDNYRWFPQIENYAKNQLQYLSESHIENQKEWLDTFNETNEHIRTKEKIKLF